MNDETKKIWHVIFFTFYDNVPESVRQEAYNKFQRLAEDCGGHQAGILFWLVENNMNPKKNAHIVEISVFENQIVLDSFRSHPKHKEMTDFMSKISDWQVGDILGPADLTI